MRTKDMRLAGVAGSAHACAAAADKLNLVVARPSVEFHHGLDSGGGAAVQQVSRPGYYG